MDMPKTATAPRGRPPIKDGRKLSAGIFMRCSEAQKEALEAYVAKLNVARARKGKSPIELSAWIREVALAKAGLEDLGVAGDAKRLAGEAGDL